MNIGFHVFRDNYIKLYGPVVDFFLKKQCNVFLFCDYRQKPSEMGYKTSLFPAAEKIPEFDGKPVIITFENIGDLAASVRQNNVKVVFFVNFDPVAGQLKQALDGQDYSFIVAELQYFLELIFFGKDLSNTDVIYTHSENWKEWWKQRLISDNFVNESNKDALFDGIEKKSVVVGVPEADQVKNFDNAVICKKYGIDGNKKLVVLLPFPWYGHPFPLSSGSGLWTHIAYKPRSFLVKTLRLLQHRAWDLWPDVRKGVDDVAVTKAIRAFCDRNNALFVVKAREKNPIARHLVKMADHILYDESYYPFTTLELLFAADLTIGFVTTAFMESILAQTPALCLVPQYGSMWPVDNTDFFEGDFSPMPGGFFNFDGVVYNRSVKDFISGFANQTFEDYMLIPERKEKFINKFLGYSDFHACERIYNDLCRRC